MSFTLLTVTKRSGWFDRACGQVAKQTLLPDKWIVVPEERFEIEADMPCPVEFWPAPPQIRVSNLNASLNEGLKRITSEYVIFYQDFIDLPEDCFEKLIALAGKKTFVTTCTPNYNGNNDGRYTGKKKPRPCRAEEWEANVSLAPMQIIELLGGFDEEYDNGWSWDNVNMAERAAMLGCKFVLDESNRPRLLLHELTSKLTMEPNGEHHAKTMNEIRVGIRPLKCNYL